MKINKKNFFFGFIAMAFISLSSCNKIKDAIQADVDITPNGATFTIPKITNTDQHKIAGSENISALDISEYKGLKSIVLKSLKVELLDQKQGSNFKALDNISVHIISGTKTAVLATKTNTDFTNNQYSIEIPTNTTIDIKEFVKNTFSYEISGKAHTTTEEEVQAKLTAVYTVKFGL